MRDRADFMTSEETVEIARRFVEMGVKKIRLTGGEPLIKKDIANILHQLSKLDVELGLTTNGVLVDRYIEDFKRAGINAINVSLDSLKKERFNHISRREYFDRILNNVELLLKEGFKTKVNVVLMKGVNSDEVIDFVEWTKDRNVQVRFIEFMPFNGNNCDWDKKVSFHEILSQINEHYGEDQLIRLDSRPNDTTKNFRIGNYLGSIGIISSVTNPFCDTCNRIRLTADGKIKNCLFASNETDLLTALRNGDDIKQLIRQSILAKKKQRAGIESFESVDPDKIYSSNRSMTTIGG